MYDNEDDFAFDDINDYENNSFDILNFKLNKTAKINMSYSCDIMLEDKAAEVLNHFQSIIEEPLLINV